MAIVDGSESEANLVEGEIMASIYMGSMRQLVVSLGGAEWHVEAPADTSFVDGATVKLRLAPEKIWLLADDGASRAEWTA